jgi:uncharacterized protein (TIGR02722 family)
MTHLRQTLSVGALALVTALLLAGCGTSVERMEVTETRDLSGNWNDTDSRLVSEEMIKDVLGRPWLDEHQRLTGARPAIIVGEIRNLSHEHINTGTFVGDMERELINSGRVDFVASKTERGEIREERADQDVNASPDTQNAPFQELGADYMLKGSINSIVDQEGKESVKFYQIDLTLISLRDNRKVWVGQKKLKKFVKKDALRL